MSYIEIPTRTSSDVAAAADINQLQDNITYLYETYYPVGSFYIQFPNATSNDTDIAFPSSKAPAALFGGTWTKVFDTEGIFFRTEGNPKLNNGTTVIGSQNGNRVNGLQNDQMQRIYGELAHNKSNYIGRLAVDYVSGALSAKSCTDWFSKEGGGAFTTANGIHVIDSTLSSNSRASSDTVGETRPINRLIRVWKRTA